MNKLNKARKSMEKEEWRVIEDHPDYEVSNMGRVRNCLTKLILKLQISNKGYMRANIAINGRAKHMAVHRLVAKEFIPNPDNKPQVNHIDGNTVNNKATNLEWCTGRENVHHAFETRLRQDNNFVTVYDQDEDKTLEFRSAHQAAEHLNVSDEAVIVWKVRSEYAPIDGRYIIKDVNVRRPKDSAPLYVYDHVDDKYTNYANRMDFVLNTGLSPYTVLERLRKYKQLTHYIAGYTVSEKELKDVERKKTALQDRMKLFSKPVVKAKMPIEAQFKDGSIKKYDSINDFVIDQPDITVKEVSIALGHGRSHGVTFMTHGVNVKYQEDDIPFTEYNKYAIENNEMGMRFDTPVFKLTYGDDISFIRSVSKLASLVGSRTTAVVQKYRLGRVVMTKDASSNDLVVERVN